MAVRMAVRLSHPADQISVFQWGFPGISNIGLRLLVMLVMLVAVFGKISELKIHHAAVRRWY